MRIMGIGRRCDREACYHVDPIQLVLFTFDSQQSDSDINAVKRSA